MLNLHLEDLLIKLGAVYRKQAYPQHVYLAASDYKLLEKNIRKQFKKEYPHTNNETSIQFYLLNLGPSLRLKKAVKPGYAIIDVDAIERENHVTQK